MKVELLHQNGPQADPLAAAFDYKAEFEELDYEALKNDIKIFLTTLVAWWPSDYGNYGPQMIRMAWHASGTYRIADGRGGAGEALQRFAVDGFRNYVAEDFQEISLGVSPEELFLDKAGLLGLSVPEWVALVLQARHEDGLRVAQGR